jgi:8-oxo-dGTP pyrophosphatase MutT (NUDIX family)
VTDLAAIAARLRRTAEAGLAGSRDPYNLDRYRRAAHLATALETLVTRVNSITPAPTSLDVRTPALGAEAAIFDDAGLLLLIRRAGDGTWALPGGICEVGESPAATAVREVREELGIDVETSHLVGVYDNRLIGAPGASVPVAATYACRIIGGRPAVSAEVLEFGWFAPDGVRALTLFHAHPAKIAAAFADRIRRAG